MTEECPNCRQLTNASFSRLVKDSCGHTKCRMCLLYEEHGCKACDNERQNAENYECSPSKYISSTTVVNSKIITNEEIILPLELVINKDSKPVSNCYQLVSVDCISEINSKCEGINLINPKESCKSPTTDISEDNISNKLNIPKIEPHEVVLNICTHLNNTNHPTTEPLQPYNKLISDDNDSKVKLESLDKEKLLKNKSLKCPDRSHISVIPGTPERYKCNICSKVFRNKKGKCYHDACITGIRPYQCTFCDRSFVKRSHFEYHERVHSGYKPFKCTLCEKAFPQQNKLNRHMYSHSKERRFLCPKCNKGYTKQDDLKNHLSVHNSTATYSCKTCEKGFRILTNLKRHMRTHTSERPYTCDQCSKSFKDKSLLIRHKKTHGKDRPFSCAHCNRVFLSKSELRRHLTVHSDEKPFACEYCQTVFRRKDNLNRHIRHHHSEDSSFESNKIQDTVSNASTKIAKAMQNNPKQKQKPKKAPKAVSGSLPKGPNPKVSVVYTSSLEQINSRLDSMGNITPVIRTTSEVTNAVPVINGPISIKRPEEKTDTRKKTFSYTEPIPLAEAVVINRRIEEKLYPQNVSNHNYFYRSYSSCTDKSYSMSVNQTPRTNSNIKSIANKTVFSQNSSSGIASSLETNFPNQNIESADFEIGAFIEKDKRTVDTERGNYDNERHSSCHFNETCQIQATNINKTVDINAEKTSCLQKTTNRELSNCVSTITKHDVQQYKSTVSERITSINDHFKTVTNIPSVVKNEDTNEKKQSNVHWRRRITEILKPYNQ